MSKRLVPLLLALSLLAGCAAGAGVPERSKGVSELKPTEVRIADLFPAQRTAENDAAFSQFAVELLRQNRTEGENTLLSPLSAALALGMTSAGADGDTAAGFADLFGIDLGSLLSYCLALTEDYADPGGSTESTLVNSLWCDPDLTLKDAFILTCQHYFAAQLFHADLQDSATVKAVNDWVKEATQGLIPDVVDRFSDEAVLALVNAVYLKNKFQVPFETPQSEWTMDFTAADGTVTTPRGMSNGTRNEQFIAAQDGRGVVLPYDDGRLGLLLMLPDEGIALTDYLAAWTGETVKALLDAREERRTSLVVPKFKAEWAGSLADSLARMGLEDAFDPEKADFAAMGECEAGPLYIGDVIHKTAFELNEKGTEAAAVTAVIMDFGAAPPPEDLVVLRFERPFVYGIVDLETGTPLFLGTAETLE